MTDPARYVHRTGMRLSALALAAVGLLFLFAPDEAAGALGGGGRVVLVQAFGGALLGFAAANWTASGAHLGGIYGRSIVVGNQTHFFVGALVLLRDLSHAGGSALYWTVCIVYVVQAAWFSWLMFGGGLRAADA